MVVHQSCARVRTAASAASSSSGAGMYMRKGKKTIKTKMKRAISTCRRKSLIARASGGAESVTDSLAEKLAAGAATRVGELLRELPTPTSVARSADQEETNSSTSQIDMALRMKIEAGVRQLARGLVERETECRLLMLGALSGEHVLLVGPPGTAKSELGRRLSTICTGVRLLIHRNTTKSNHHHLPFQSLLHHHGNEHNPSILLSSSCDRVTYMSGAQEH